MILLLLPCTAFATYVLIFRTVLSSRREAALVASAWFTLTLVALTEALSAEHAITRIGLANGWLCISVLGTVIVSILRRRATPVGGVTWTKSSTERLARNGSEIKWATPSLSEFLSWLAARGRALCAPRQETIFAGLDRLMLAGTILIFGLVGVTAFVSPPNGSDQLQYHLPRVFEWANRHSIAFFPTHYYVQLFAPPLAEWMMLHSYVLTAGDRFVGLVQWLAFLGSAVTVSLTARELGADRRGQILAALLCATLPQGILAASGAKNDWVLAFWLAAAIFFLLRWFRETSWLASCNLGISLGAAILSKGSVYAFLPPILLALSTWGLRSHWRARIEEPAQNQADSRKIASNATNRLWAGRALRALKHAPAIIAVVLLMNGLQWGRNYSLGGSFFGLSAPDTDGKEKYGVDRISVPGVASNVLREAAMHLGTPSDAVNRRETNLVRWVISRLGADPDDPAATNYSAFQIPQHYYALDEYYAGNPLHLLLAGFTFSALLISWRSDTAGAAFLAAGIAGGFVLYCSLFRWEIWCARLHLPLFVAAAAVAAVVLCQRLSKLVVPIALLAMVSAIPPMLFNSSRPLLFSGGFRSHGGRTSIFLQSRQALYFTQQLSLKESYLAAAEAVKREKCTDIGMDTSIKPYSHEYPLMELSRKTAEESRLRYVDVHNLSSKYADGLDLIEPCVVICPNCRNSKEKWDEYSPALPVTRVFGDLVLFSRTPAAEAVMAARRN